MVNPKADQAIPHAYRKKPKRVPLACGKCRDRKVRCDGVKPICGPCHKRNWTESECLFLPVENNARTQSEQEYIKSLQSRIQQLESLRSDADEPSASHDEVQQEQSSLPFESNDSTQTFSLSQSNRNNVLLSGRVAEKSQNTAFGGNAGQGSDDGVLDDQIPSPVASSIPAESEPASHSLKVNVHTSLSQSPTAGFVPEDQVNAMGVAIPSPTIGNVEYGDRNFGKSSLISLLRLLRPNMTSSVNKSPELPQRQGYNRGHHVGPMLPNLPTFPKSAELFSLPSRAVADELLDLYFDDIHIFYPWVHTQTFISAYGQLWSGHGNENLSTHKDDIGLGGPYCQTTIFYCALNAVFALACEFSQWPSDKRESMSAIFFGRLKNLLQLELMGQSNLAVIQTLLLVAMYLQCTQHHSLCWTIVGLACRIAQGLGLYLESSQLEPSNLISEMRRRVWYGCVLLDRFVSMTLGRPMITAKHQSIPLPLAVDDEFLIPGVESHPQPSFKPSKNHFYVENIKLVEILKEILAEVYQPWNESEIFTQQMQSHGNDKLKFDTIITLESALTAFELQLPSHFSWKDEDMDIPGNPLWSRQKNVLRARFLHIKILLYRPAFSRLCGRKRWTNRNISSTNLEGNDALGDVLSKGTSLYDFIMLRCAISCLESVCDLVDLLHKAVPSHSTGAWWYGIFYLNTCAIILVLAEANDELSQLIRKERLHETWQQCQETLHTMSFYQSSAQQMATTLEALRQHVKFQNNAGLESENSEYISSHYSNTSHPDNRDQPSQPSRSPETANPDLRHPSYQEFFPTGVSYDPTRPPYMDLFGYHDMSQEIDGDFSGFKLPLAAMFYELDQGFQNHRMF